jgi:murein L,D-transpeptidase YcbB/YkuD
MVFFLRRPLGPLLLVALLGALWSSPARAESVSDILQARLAPALQAGTPLQLSRQSAPRALAEFYAARQWQPAWDAPRLDALLLELDKLRADGLTPDDYGYTRLRQWLPPASAAQQADRDLLATRACLLALLHLFRGKVDPAQLDPYWNLDARQMDPRQGLQRVLQAVEENRLAALFDFARPALPYYQQLRGALAALRAQAQAGGWPQIPEGPTLKPGMTEARVALLRRRLLPDSTVEQPEFYDEGLRRAVQRFQRDAYLEADGAVGRATLAELNVPLAARIDQLRVNLERTRWFGNDLRGRAVIVDLAGYAIYFLEDGQPRWRSRVQIGREFRPSPVFQSTLSHLTLSPAWTVPPTILREDILPALRRDPAYLARRKLQVIDADGRALPPAAVDWRRPGNVRLRQEPGPDGALGEIALRFRNPFAIYLHDTPSKELFGASRRSTSSGCIRVENIHELAVLLLDDPVHWSRAALQAVIDERRTREVALPRPVPILLGYWTVQIAEDGYLSFRPDVYHRDPPLLAALNAGAPL